MRKNLAFAVMVFCASASFAGEQARDLYEKSFAAHARTAMEPRLVEMLVQKGLSDDQAKQTAQEFVNASISCHMNSMDQQSAKVSAAAYQAIVSGGTYADANMAFELALGDAQSAQDGKAIAQFKVATEKAIDCIKSAQANTGL